MIWRKTRTNFIDKYMSGWNDENWRPGDGGPPDEVLIAAALADMLSAGGGGVGGGEQASLPTPWQTTGKWEIGGGA